jgi:hypothetical protein
MVTKKSRGPRGKQNHHFNRCVVIRKDPRALLGSIGAKVLWDGLARRSQDKRIPTVSATEESLPNAATCMQHRLCCMHVAQSAVNGLQFTTACVGPLNVAEDEEWVAFKDACAEDAEDLPAADYSEDYNPDKDNSLLYPFGAAWTDLLIGITNVLPFKLTEEVSDDMRVMLRISLVRNVPGINADMFADNNDGANSEDDGSGADASTGPDNEVDLAVGDAGGDTVPDAAQRIPRASNSDAESVPASPSPQPRQASSEEPYSAVDGDLLLTNDNSDDDSEPQRVGNATGAS